MTTTVNSPKVKYRECLPVLQGLRDIETYQWKENKKKKKARSRNLVRKSLTLQVYMCFSTYDMKYLKNSH